MALRTRTLSRHLSHYTRRGSALAWKVGAFIIGFIGLSGIPDDLAKWETWIDKAVAWADQAMTDPRVQALAQYAVAVADFVNQWWVRGLLIVASIIIFAWAWRPFWRWRHRVTFKWRRLLAEQIWISRDAALLLLRESTWGRIKEPREYSSIFTVLQLQLDKAHGVSETQKKRILFEEYLEATLAAFCQDNPRAVKQVDGATEIDETTLRIFLKQAIEAEIKDAFGDVPRITVA